MQKLINEELDAMLGAGIVEKSDSPWASPIVMVKKKDNSFRMCVDFRKLNAVTAKDSYPLPFVSATLDKLKGAKFLSTIDVKSAFWQVPISRDSRKYTAFTVPGRGLFQFTRMPFGLHNATATWQRLMDEVIGGLDPHAFAYVDDIVISTTTFEDHLRVLGEIFNRLKDANITISRAKCHFCVPSIKYLGYIVDVNGLHVDPEKVQGIVDIPSPSMAASVQFQNLEDCRY